MTFTYALSLAAVAAAGGLVGSLLGLGGGIIIVPLYSLVFGMPVHVAVGTSLVAVVATASSASTAYLGSRVANVRLALVLAVVAAAGALGGGLVGTSLRSVFITGAFGLVLLVVGVLMLVRPEAGAGEGRSPQPAPGCGAGGAAGTRAGGLSLAGTYFDPASGARVTYQPRSVPTGLALSFLAGGASGLLGIGGGVVQVPVMNLLLGVPMKAAAATSSHIISLTAVAGAVVYLVRGYVDPFVAAVTIIGVFLGARGGTRLARILPGRSIKRVFSLVLFYMALHMLARALDLGFLS